MMKRYLITLIVLAVAFVPDLGHADSTTFQGRYAITHARLVDGLGGRPLENATLIIDGGRITQIGTDLPIAGMPELDATGLTALPGLIDSHVHLNSVPGALVRGDTREVREQMRAEQLASYIASGVTTILDAAAPMDLHAWVGEHVARGKPSPRVLMLAPFVTPAGGYFSSPVERSETYHEMWPAIDGVETLRRSLDAVTGVPNVVGVKVTMEAGFGPIVLWDIFDAPMRQVIRDETARRGLPIYVHSMKDGMHRLALDLKPKAFLHAGYGEGTPKAETLAQIREAGIPVISTLAVYDMLLVRWERRRLRDAQLRLVTPPLQLATADDARAWEQVNLEMAATNAPAWLPRFLYPSLAKVFLSQSAMRQQVASSLSAVGKMHAAGIPMVVGTDSGCWPLLTTMFHGSTTLRELELLVQAGLTPMEAIVAATSRPAKLHGIDAETGTLEAGKLADILLVRGAPDVTISNIRRVAWVLKSGDARTPQEWMKAGRR